MMDILSLFRGMFVEHNYVIEFLISFFITVPNNNIDKKWAELRGQSIQIMCKCHFNIQNLMLLT